MRPGLFYEWIGQTVAVRLLDGAEVEGILLEVAPPWIVVQERGVPRHIQTEGGVVIDLVFDRQNPYYDGHQRALRRLREGKGNR